MNRGSNNTKPRNTGKGLVFGVEGVDGVEGNSVEIEEGIKKKKRKSARTNTTTKKKVQHLLRGSNPRPLA